jgi:hypothetical protein
MASPMTAAAISSGLIVLKDPDGAFPTGVRTAETMTASAIEILHQILDGIADLAGAAVE